jgi:hypothetical protein
MDSGNQQLTTEELTERFYLVRGQRDKLIAAVQKISRWLYSDDTPCGQQVHEIERIIDDATAAFAIGKVQWSREVGPITVDWLHSIAPDGWQTERRGISYANWTIHSIVSNGNYDDGPFVWNVGVSHGPNLIPIAHKPGGVSNFTILVLESRRDVRLLLQLLQRDKG